jgi:hypothetical protein
MIELTNILKEAQDNIGKNDTTVVHGIYDPDYSDYGLVLFNSPKQVKDFAIYGLKNSELLNGKDFKTKYIEFNNKKLQKVTYTKKLNIGSNLGEGEYWCTNESCIEIYSGETPDSRVYAKYVDKIVDRELPDNLNILVKEGFVDDIRFS